MNYFSEENILLMNSEQRQLMFEELFEHATESIIVINHEGKIKFINPATKKLFGYNQQELEGQTVEFLMPERFAHKHVHNREIYNQNPHPRSMGIGMDLFARRKDGSEFPVEISLSPFKRDDQSFVIAFIIDITKRKQAEDAIVKQRTELLKLADELRASNEKLESKVEARTKVLSEALAELEKSKHELSEALEKEKELSELKTRFISMASHEFRTPLTTILSSASLIPEYPQTDQQDKRMKHIARITSAVNNLNDILSDFLSISKIEEGKVLPEFSKFNLKELIEEVLGDMKNQFKPGQKFIFIYTGEQKVLLDKKLMRNILINLLSNAIKFSEDDKKITINCDVTDESTTIVFSDEGIGISEDDKKHLFERFFRGHNATNIQGTGLGLNIVADYVQLMNGKIEMQSELNKGTTIKLIFNSTD